MATPSENGLGADILNSIQRVLPKLDASLANDVAKYLINTVGVESLEDLELVATDNLSSLLNVIQVKKLLSCWSEYIYTSIFFFFVCDLIVKMLKIQDVE